jgi:chemotaxis protein MotB
MHRYMLTTYFLESGYSPAVEAIQKQWHSLRTNVMTESHIEELAEQFTDKLKVSGALERESVRWPESVRGESKDELIAYFNQRMEFLDSYYNELANSKENEEGGYDGDLKDQLTEAGKEESEGMAEDIKDALDELGVSNNVDIRFDAQSVTLNLSGGILFKSGKADIMPDAVAIIDKIIIVLQKYDKNLIEVEGHTDNVPMTSGLFENNDVLSMYRALSVANYIREHSDLDAANIKSSGRGEYAPIADNDTAEGRARNRRVEIKIYNSYASQIEE